MKNIETLYSFTAVIGIVVFAATTARELSNTTRNQLRQEFIYPGSSIGTVNTSSHPPLHEVPVLCYHQIREWERSDSKNARGYIVSPGNFEQQINILVDSGYHFILPNQLLSYISTKSKLPEKPILISFDDGTIGQYTRASPVLNRANIKAVFFLMTVVLNRPHYLSSAQVRTLSDQGHTIGCHTWDHHNVTDYSDHDWKIQVEEPLHQLEKITGRPIKFFAYPYGAWNETAINALKTYGFEGAFQLAGKQDTRNAAFTIRRIIVDGNWNGHQLLHAIKYSFK